MKFIITIILIYLIVVNSFAQNAFSTYQIKEQFDAHEKVIVGYPTYHYLNSTRTDSSSINHLGDRMPYVLESYIKMYETTKDKAYLIRFIHHAIGMQEERGAPDSDIDVGSQYSFSNYMYHNGLICWAFAHFVHLVKMEEPALNTLALPPNIILYNSFGFYGSNQWNTYGAFAEWLRIRTEETLDYFTYEAGYWADDTRCYIPEYELSKVKTARAQSVNQQAGFACALFYLGLTDPNTDYLHKAAEIAKAYKGIVIDQGCKQKKNGKWKVSGTAPRLVTVTLSSNNSYIWKSAGWRIEHCGERHGDKPDDYEDLAHGIQTLIFPMAIHNKLESNDVMLFDDTDMERYSNTFSENVFGQYSGSCPNIHGGVDGDDVIAYRINDKGVHDYDGLNNSNMLQAALAWMHFYKFNPATPPYDVYSIIMNLYDCRFKNNRSAIDVGQSYYGLSEVVKAQWEKECNDLILYNRKVVYNQDFFAKGNLTVAPAQITDANYTASSFADPIITDQKFTVEAGTNVKMRAGTKIILKHGFHAKQGSNFRAYIDPSLNVCNSQVAAKRDLEYEEIPSNKENEQSNDTTLITLNQNTEDRIQETEEKTTTFKIYPNPSNGTFNIEMRGERSEASKASIKIMNLLGQTIYKSEIKSAHQQIDLSAHPIGIYILHLQTENEIITRKIIKE